MVFSGCKIDSLKPQKEKYFSTFLIALATAIAFFVPYIIMSEGYFTFAGDFNAEQISFYQLCHKAVKDGDIFWNWNTGLGGSFIGSYGLYLLGSPFFWLTIPFPNWLVPYLMGPILILKFSLSALTAYFYIRRFTRTPLAARLGGLLYAFSGFSICSFSEINFHEAMIFFPLLLLSLELLITENKRMVFAVAVAVCAISNFYFFFGMLVFLSIYFFVRLFSGAITIKFSRFLIIVLETILGTSLAAFLILPTVVSLINTANLSNVLLGQDTIIYKDTQTYTNILWSFLFPISSTENLTPVSWLPLFSTVGVLGFFANQKKTWLKIIIALCILIAFVPILNSVFYGFNESYSSHWFYMPILMLCLATATTAEDSIVNWSPSYRWVLTLTVILTALIGFFPQNKSNGEVVLGLYNKENGYSFWITSLVATISLIILGLVLKSSRKNNKAFLRNATIFVSIIAVIFGNLYIALNRFNVQDSKENVIDSLIEADVKLPDNEEYRVDVYDGTDNTSMYLGLNDITAKHSITNSSIKEFYDYVGEDDGTDAELRALLSVKYLLNPKHSNSFIDKETHATKMVDYQYIKTEDNYYIYENKNYIPYGFSYDYYMSYDYCNSLPQNQRSAAMLKAILLNSEQIREYGSMMKNLENFSSYNYADYTYTDKELAKNCENLKETSATEFKINNNGFTATVERREKNLVFFSVPYDKGWNAYVNGNLVKIEKVNAGFMAVLVPEGINDIQFIYNPPYLVTGLIITGGTAVLTLIYLIIWFILSKRIADNNIYPEGNELLRLWGAQEMREEEEAEIPDKEPYFPRRSILDDDISTEIPHIEPKFNGGFEINKDLFKDDE